eukprot:sb/3465600/
MIPMHVIDIDACKFGVSESVIGLILGMYHLTVFVVAPVTPILIGKLTVELTLKLGILVAGISAILFGFLNLITNRIAFILVSVVLRCIQGCGCAFVDTSLYTIVSDRFSHNVGKVSGILTTSVGVGFMVGPPLGGFFYTLGGFFLPFVVMGSLTLIMWVLMVLVLPTTPATPKRRRLFSLYAYIEQDGLEQSIVGYTDSKDGTHWASMAREIPFVPNVQLGDHISLKNLMDLKLLSILFTTMVGSSILGFQEPNLSIFLENAGFKEGAIGGLFLLRDFFFAVGSIGIGYLVDAIGPYSILGVGLALGSAGYCVLGPIPPFDPTLFSIIMGLAVTGFAGSIPWVAGLPCLLKATRHHGNKKSLNSQLSGLQNSCLYFGIFVGKLS